MSRDLTRTAVSVALGAALAVGGVAVAAQVVIDPLPDITRPEVRVPEAEQPGYGVLGQGRGYLAGIADQGNYLQAIGDVVVAQTQMLVGFLVGLCLLVGYVLRPYLTSGRGVSGVMAGLLGVFAAAAVASAYCGYRANLAVLAQASEAIVYLDGLEAPIALQATFLLVMVAAALSLVYLQALRAEAVPGHEESRRPADAPARAGGGREGCGAEAAEEGPRAIDVEGGGDGRD